MKNLWISHKDSFVMWAGGFAYAPSGEPDVMEWLQRLLRTGEEVGVYKVREAPSASYLYERDGHIWKFLGREYAKTGEFTGFGFAASEFADIDQRKLKLYGQIAYYNREKQIEEADVDDMGALLAWLRPEDADENGWSIWMRHNRPVEVGSYGVGDYRTAEQKAAGWHTYSFFVRLHTDIWFPWVYGFNEENNDVKKRFSNHELAKLHTPRLNEFIQTVRQATLDMGGKWEIDTTESHYTRRSHLFMLSEEGINLDAPLPAEYSENHTLYFG